MTRRRKRMGNAILGSRMNELNEPERIRLDDDSIINSRMDTGDCFSKLPESLMLRILFFLPARDVARTSLLSKTWRRLWSSLPTQSFKFDYSTFQNNYVPEEGENLGSEEMLDKFIKFVDDSLFRIRGEKIKIESFLLHLPSYYENKLQTHTNEWIELVTKNPIKELEIWSDSLHVNIERYVLPRAICIAKSLSTLNLKGLKLNETILAGDFKFPCLRSLSLSVVNLTREKAENLLSSCPLLEKFSMRPCQGLTHLCIPNLPMLKKVHVCGLDRIVIEAANLETLDYTFHSSEWDLGALACNNLKELRVRSEPTTINEYVEEIFSKFLLLETLDLDYYVFPFDQLRYNIRIIIESHQLKRLNLFVSGDPDVIKIYAPNLKSYEYFSNTITIPFMFFSTASSLESAEFTMHVEDIVEIDTAWFIKLCKYLMEFKSHKLLDLTIFSNSSISFNPMEWRRYTLKYQLPIVERLKLEMSLSQQSYEALLEGLLRICHPEEISAWLLDERDRDSIKFLYNFFSRRNSSWDLHGLKGVRIFGLEVDDESGSDLELESLLILAEPTCVIFELTW